MKRITTLLEIDFSIMGTTVYILDYGVIISITKYIVDDETRYSSFISNANYSKEEYLSKSFSASSTDTNTITQDLAFYIYKSILL